jgi:hypothetical protein
MSKTTSVPQLEAEHPPLARDAVGNLLPVPRGTAAWRICRHTAGRPREICGVDKQPIRFALTTTLDELVDLCGPDAYRVYAIDELGNDLGHVTTVVAERDRGIRNLGELDAPLLTALRGPAPPSSDLRFALEAMAQMMRTNSEALRAVTSTQADCVKALVSVRGFFRNAPQLALPAPEPKNDEETDDDEDDFDEPVQGKTICDVLAPIAEHWAPAAAPFVAMLAGGAQMKPATDAPVGPPGATKVDADLASRPNWEFRDFIDLNYAAAKTKAKKAAKQHAAESGATNGAAPSLQARVMADPKLMAHFLAIKSRLTADDTAHLLALGERMTQQEQEFLIAQISSASPDEAAALLRGMLAELTKSNGTAETK